jgi:hypothetical protein
MYEPKPYCTNEFHNTGCKAWNRISPTRGMRSCPLAAVHVSQSRTRFAWKITNACRRFTNPGWRTLVLPLLSFDFCKLKLLHLLLRRSWLSRRKAQMSLCSRELRIIRRVRGARVKHHDERGDYKHQSLHHTQEGHMQQLSPCSILVIMIILLVFYLRSLHQLLAKWQHLFLSLVVAGHIFSPTIERKVS